ncbi:MAG: hypothetical protein AB7O37_22445 [Vicinamibacteria bacterium]
MRRSFWRRGVRGLALGAILVLLVGDGVRGAASGGIDPLEVLKLSVKPNVIVVLDSSGSMTSAPGGGGGSLTGDWTESRMYKAKQVLKQVVQANESDVNFMFGQYTQTPALSDFRTSARFRYVTTDTSMATSELALYRTPSNESGEPGFQIWQDIRANWNTLYYGEQINATSYVNPSIVISAANNKFYYAERERSSPYRYHVCVVTLPASAVGGSFPATLDDDVEMSDLAAELTSRMQAGTHADRVCTDEGGNVESATNNFSVTWDSANYRFSIRVTSYVRPYIWYGPSETNSIAGTIGFTGSLPNSGRTVANVTTNSGWSSSTSTYDLTPLGGTITTSSVVVCAVPIAAQFYQTGQALATALQNAMNNDATCNLARGATRNTYTVTYRPTSGPDFQFSRASGVTNPWQMRWADTPNNIAGALGQAGVANTSLGAGSFITNDTTILLRRRNNDSPHFNSTDNNTTFGGVTYYWADAGKFFNGETFYVLADGTFCGIASSVAPSDPPTLKLARVSACSSTTELQTVTFTFQGGVFGGGSNTCNGFQSRVPLALCDTTQSQFSIISPLLENEIRLTGTAPSQTVLGYAESQDGGWNIASQPTTGVVAAGATPIRDSLEDIRAIWLDMWNGTPNPAIDPAVGAISAHTDPKERTIVMFVTDGDDTCADVSGGGTDRALAAAYEAQLLYDPIVGGVQTPSGFFTAGADGYSSVTTYVIGFGSGASTNLLNYIAWGGSGMQRTTVPDNTVTRWSTAPTTGDRTNCKTCIDAFIAPDADQLAAVLQSIIDQGATSGSFTAQQSITANVFELAGEVTGYDAFQPQQRYNVIIPTLFQASFELPGYRGQLRAFQNESGVSVEQWNAGAKLLTRVTTGINAIAPTSPATAGQLTFRQLHGGLSDSAVTTSAAMGIRRRIYTTDRNGYFDVIQSGANPFAGLFAGSVGVYDGSTAHGRVALWPPTTADVAASVAPTDTGTGYSTVQGLLDVAMGLPSNATITGWSAAEQATELARLQANFGACRGSNLNPQCASATVATQIQAARKEAREMMLAFVAGAEPVLDVNGDPTRLPSTATPANQAYQILYQARTWILAESSLAPPAVVGPPIGQKPNAFSNEYQYYTGEKPVTAKVNALSAGFGLRDPDKESGQADTFVDTRSGLKPVMTTIYIGANDMLHAFRAGPSCKTPGAGNTYAVCAEQGGEELWGFLPFDQLGKLQTMRQPQERDTKTYVVAAPVRFADVFVPVSAAPDYNPASSPDAIDVTPVSGLTLDDIQGVWRQVIYFGRGPGGKYLTALDVTNRGAYTLKSIGAPGVTAEVSGTNPPIPWWSRGNPDTFDGVAGTTETHSTADTTAYSKMGETWSVPAIAFVDKAANATTRRPYNTTSSKGGIGVVAYAGSGYSDVSGEGATFYTLDALNGDPVAAADVEAQALTDGVQRSGLPYANALVAPPAAFSKKQLIVGQTAHPADPVTRVYIGDVHGRLWKIVSADPTKAVLMADLGEDQAVGVGAALIALDEKPYVYVAAGNDSRATGPFKFFGFRDDGSDTDTTHGTPTAAAGDSAVQVASPAVFLFSQEFDTNFRGTLQPATAFTTDQLARVFFGGTRFNEPGSLFAPVPYPCRSSFDSVIYAVGAETGGAAYDFGGDSFLVLENSRKTALQIIKEPAAVGSAPGTSGGSRLIIDEGLMSGGAAVVPPPPPGEQPKTVAGVPTISFALSDAAKNIPVFPQGTPPRVCQ